MATTRFAEAVKLHQQGDLDAAEAIYRALIAEAPDEAGALHLLGVVHLQRSQYIAALDFIGRAIAISSEKAVYFNNYGAALHGLGKHVEALARWQDLLNAGAFPNFSYSYLGRNVRSLKEQFASFYNHYFSGAPEPQGSGLPARRRLGIVVTQRHEGIFLRCLAGVLRGLSPELFEVVILSSTPSVRPLREGLRIPRARFISFGNHLEEAARTIREARCDVLYFWEAGSDALNYFLPFCRLAPIQCTSQGSQVTSGNPAIHYFCSSRLVELETAQEHYSERLCQAESLLMNQPRLPLPPPAEPTMFGLPSNRTLYMCLQNPLKIHPQFDALLAGVLRSDPAGVAVLLKGSFDFAEIELRRRFARSFPDACERVVFLPNLKFPEYCQLMNLADVVLDPLHFGHVSSAYDVFSFNRPLVTLPTALNTGRAGAACYSKMGLPELVPTNCEEYVELAVRLGLDRDFHAQTVKRISAASDSLFDDYQAVRDHERFFGELVKTI